MVSIHAFKVFRWCLILLTPLTNLNVNALIFSWLTLVGLTTLNSMSSMILVWSSLIWGNVSHWGNFLMF